jgi:colanic acid biosynthesis glycosyl transferase WcaI
MVDADLCVIPQQAGTGKFFFPSKLLSALSFARPILSISDPTSDLAQAVEEGAFGLNVEPNEPKEIATAIEKFSNDPEGLKDQSRAAEKFVKRFDQQTLLNKFHAELVSVRAFHQTQRIIPPESPLRKMVFVKTRKI